MTGTAKLRGRRLTALLAALTALPALSIDMGLPALPELAASFGVGQNSSQLSIALFLAGFALGQLALGRSPIAMADGRSFLRASACSRPLASDAPSPRHLRHFSPAGSARVGAAAGPVLARAIIRDLFSGTEATARLAQAAAIMALAPMVAPAVGVLILSCFGWRSIFADLGACGRRSRPHRRTPSRGDHPGARSRGFGAADAGPERGELLSLP